VFTEYTVKRDYVFEEHYSVRSRRFMEQ